MKTSKLLLVMAAALGLFGSKCKKDSDAPKTSKYPLIQGIGLPVQADGVIYAMDHHWNTYDLVETDTSEFYARQKDSFFTVDMFLGEIDNIELGDVQVGSWDCITDGNAAWYYTNGSVTEDSTIPQPANIWDAVITHSGSTDWPAFTIDTQVVFADYFTVRMDTILAANQSHTFQLPAGSTGADSMAIVRLGLFSNYSVVKMLPGNASSFVLNQTEVDALADYSEGYLFVWGIKYRDVYRGGRKYTIVSIREYMYNNIITQ